MSTKSLGRGEEDSKVNRPQTQLSSLGVRFIYLILITVAFLIALLLIAHSVLVFTLYIVAGATTLLVMLRRRGKSGTVPDREIKGAGMSDSVGDAGVETRTDSANEDSLPAEVALRSTVWRRLLVLFASPLLLFGILWLINRWGLAELSNYKELIIALLFLVNWILMLWSLYSISKILLFKRALTKFPRWSMLFGVVTACAMVLCALSPLSAVLLLQAGCAAPHHDMAPPSAFDVNQTIQVAFDGVLPAKISEQYQIEPKSHYVILTIEETESLDTTAPQIDRKEMFVSDKFGETPLETMQLEQHRNLTRSVQNLGLFRSKLTFPPPSITLLVKDLTEPAPTGSQKALESGPGAIIKELEFTTSRAEHFHREIKIELPKNSYLASSPKGDFISLPDKDVITMSMSGSEAVELYYLRRARFKLVTSVMGSSSKNDLAISAMAGLFWPAALILIGKFHSGLSDRVSRAFSSLFGKKEKKRVVGFGPKTK